MPRPPAPRKSAVPALPGDGFERRFELVRAIAAQLWKRRRSNIASGCAPAAARAWRCRPFAGRTESSDSSRPLRESQKRKCPKRLGKVGFGNLGVTRRLPGNWLARVFARSCAEMCGGGLYF